MKKIKNYFKSIGRVFVLSFKSSKKYTLLICAVNVLMGISIPINILVWKHLIDAATAGIKSGNWHYAGGWIILYSFFLIVGNVLSLVNDYLENVLAGKMNIYTTNRIITCVSNLPMDFFDNPRNYDKIQKVNLESNSRTMSMLKTIVYFLRGLLTLSGTVAILMQVSVVLLIILSTICIPTLILSLNLACTEYNIYNDRIEDIRYINHLKNMMTEYENIKEMKINCSYSFFLKYINNKYETFFKTDKRIKSKYTVKMSTVNTIEQIIICLIRIYLLCNVILLKKTIGDLLLYISAIDNFRGSVISILNTVASIYEDGLYISNVFEFFKLEGSGYEKNNIKKKKIDEVTEIVFENVWFKYPNTDEYILKNFNLKLEKGKSYSFVGLNGSGKTTIIKLILNLYIPEKGKILINGVSIKDLDIGLYLKNIGVVFQDFMKYPLKVSENISISSIQQLNNLKKIQEAAKMAGADEFIQSMPQKYNTQLSREWKDGVQLSLGQWQKIAISRAFVEDFPIVILDEPTASLDAYAEFELYKKFKEMISGKTSILIAHRFSTIRLADEIFVLKNGTIVENGSHEELLKKNGEYAHLYSIQAQEYK